VHWLWRVRIRRKGKVVWEEPSLPPYVKLNPHGVPDPGEQQPGDLSIGMAARELLAEGEEPEE
jgi:hypothetical protein